ncbi:hypothetical protein, partial [Streptomyces sp. NPDC018031]|uniref:hypothetical protein n=1 Tax=Streptomyces sp. NPDC018031 TaxID=3365033 RepID=UPI0037A27A26
GTSPTSWYTTPENVQHVAYVGDDQLIHELFHRSGVHGPASLALGLRFLRESEERAGIRAADSTGPVDYDQLAEFIPNDHWVGVAAVLGNLASAYSQLRDPAGASAAQVQRVRVLERLTQVGPEQHRPSLAQALFELLHYFRPGLDAESAKTFAQQGVEVYEVLAGLRSPGSTEPVNYNQLAAFTPNQYWEWPKLTGALYNQAWRVAHEAGDYAAAASWTVKQVRAFERLVQKDPEQHRPSLAQALFELLHYFRPGLHAESAKTFAQQGVEVYEVLAGLRSPGSTEPVNYNQLAAFTPNQYWEWPKLTGALYNQAYALRQAGDIAEAAGAMGCRINICERLALADPDKYQAALAQAQAEAAAFGA